MVAAGAPAQAAPVGHGAHWLGKQLTHGLVVNNQYGLPDDGLTIDTAFALQAVGGHHSQVRQVRRALAAQAGSYVGTGSERYAGATAKLLVFAENSGANPRSYGGLNLVKRLNNLVTVKGAAKGRIADHSQYGDYANVVGQILAVEGLTKVKSAKAGKARRFLLEQQCRQGYFRLNFSGKKSAHQACGKNSPADPDTTSYAVVQLWKASKGHPGLRRSLEHAVAWLAAQQKKNGSFAGGTSTTYANADSTGLAGWALGLAGRCSAAKAASRWVTGLQVGKTKAGSPLAKQRGAIAYRPSALKRAEKKGITVAKQDQWRRATSQATPVLAFRHGC
jgi:hypothetical protein